MPILEKLLYSPDQYLRWKYEAWLKPNAKKSIPHIINPINALDTVQDWQEWINLIKKEEEKTGFKFSINCDDVGASASYYELIPVTEMEKEEARVWLEANPDPNEGKPIKWRKPLPFTVGYGKTGD